MAGKSPVARKLTILENQGIVATEIKYSSGK
jgi:hypothetical protein